MTAEHAIQSERALRGINKWLHAEATQNIHITQQYTKASKRVAMQIREALSAECGGGTLGILYYTYTA